MNIIAKQGAISFAMTISYVMGLLLRVVLGVMYDCLIKDAESMSSTNNRNLKLCKEKFSKCYELNNGVSDVGVFVDKFINRLSIGPVTYNFIYHLSGQLIMLSVVFSGIGISRCIANGSTISEILPFYIVSFFGIYIFLSVSAVSDFSAKKLVLKTNLMDYLENHLALRIPAAKENAEYLNNCEKTMEEEKLTIKRRNDVSSVESSTESLVTAEELEALLQEFLTG